MILTIDTHKPLSVADTAILRALLGQVDATPADEAEPKKVDAWDPNPAAEAFMEGFMRFAEATMDARMSCAVEACRGLLPGPLALPEREARQIASDAWFAHDDESPMRQALQAVMALAGHCS